ncbi:hypothetical protein LTR56_022960 [Elasticomyces elasticus]|nr:hypothetical protein LTR56_022960 [Elasticomyces elasticus]KAK3626991.1 hypothetical protein LTR22_022948 [Elasticomyces elasticus]KAK4910834.1 hypothetical protein LTR49_020529 [Elasticomyces elasticus]KAK5750411.1 hypothetical protein LTS12_019519 [Elasticomyces elasticus]
MASSKDDETVRLHNEALVETLLYVNSNLGSWTRKAQQDEALLHIIAARNLQRKLTKGAKAREPHNVTSLRRLINTALNNNQKPLRPGEPKKTATDIFEHGSNLFTDEFLDEIGFDAGEQEQIIREGMQSVQDRAYNAQFQTHTDAKIERKRKSQSPVVDDSEPEELSTAEGPPPFKKTRTRKELVGGIHKSATAPHPQQLSLKRPYDIDGIVAAESALRASKKPKVDGNLASNEVRDVTRTESASRLDREAGQKHDMNLALRAEVSAEPSVIETEQKSKTERPKSAPAKAAAVGPAKVIDLDGDTATEPGLGNRREASLTLTRTTAELEATASVPVAQMPAVPQAAVSQQLPPGSYSHVGARIGIGLSGKSPLDSSQAPRSGAVPNTDRSIIQDKHNVFHEPPADDKMHHHYQKRDIPAETQPQDEASNFTTSYRSKIYENMIEVYDDAETFIYRWCLSHGRTMSAEAVFLGNPSPELEKLYQKLLGTEDWQMKLLDFQNRKELFWINGGQAGIGLVNAAVHEEVFMKPTPWDVHRRLSEAIGNDKKYFDEAIVMRGYQWDTTLKHVAWLQAFDQDFQQTEMKAHADRLAHETARTLLPHLKQLGVKPGAPAKHDPMWLRSIERTFLKALILKSKLDAAADATFEYVWVDPDVPYHRPDMRPVNTIPGIGASVHTVVPGIRMHSAQGIKWVHQPYVYCKALQAPAQAGTASAESSSA